jgi:predicted ATPase
LTFRRRLGSSVDTTSAYARQKLVACNEFGDFARRHAEYYRELFERAGVESNAQSSSNWVQAYRDQLDNVRTALDWAFSNEGNTSIATALTIVSVISVALPPISQNAPESGNVNFEIAFFNKGIWPKHA